MGAVRLFTHPLQRLRALRRAASTVLDMSSPSTTTARRRPARASPLPDTVLSIRQWAEAIGVSYSSARLLIDEGRGPIITRLLKRRIGIRVSHHHAWLNSRRDIR